MERARYLVDAVVVGGESPTRLARSHGISRSWLFELLQRFREGGYPALEPRSRRPRSNPQQTSDEVVAEVVRLRGELAEAGDDDGPQSIAQRLKGHLDKPPSVTTVWRILKRQGLVTPQPHKRPRPPFLPFAADPPHHLRPPDPTPRPR